MIHCDTTDQYFLCRWILVNFEESAVRLELIAANQVRVYTSDGYMDIFMNLTGMVVFECHLYNDPYTLKKRSLISVLDIRASFTALRPFGVSLPHVTLLVHFV